MQVGRLERVGEVVVVRHRHRDGPTGGHVQVAGRHVGLVVHEGDGQVGGRSGRHARRDLGVNQHLGDEGRVLRAHAVGAGQVGRVEGGEVGPQQTLGRMAGQTVDGGSLLGRGRAGAAEAERSSRGIRTKYYLPGYSSGSSLMMLPWWLLPTQKVTGVVELSTNTRRTLVDIGSW